MATKTPVFDYDLCISCSMCVVVCPVSTLEMNKTSIDQFKKIYPSRTDRACIGCAMCEKNCPMGAIAMEGIA